MIDPYPIDLRPFLPIDWQGQVELLSTRMRHIFSLGAGPGSLSMGEKPGLDYWTLQGDEVKHALPWTDFLHRVTLPVLMALSGDTDLKPIDGQHGISLNRLQPDSALSGLEWHVDGADVVRTVVLPPSSWDEMSGGRFLTHDGSGVKAWKMVAGIALSAPTGVMPHAVERPLREDRLTVMFAYTGPSAGLRAEAQDSYIGVGT